MRDTNISSVLLSPLVCSQNLPYALPLMSVQFVTLLKAAMFCLSSQHKGSIRASHPAAMGSILGTPFQRFIAHRCLVSVNRMNPSSMN